MATVDETNFYMPAERDFYRNIVDDTYIKMIKEKIDGDEKSEIDSTNTDDSGFSEKMKTAFYLETPAVTTLGYHKAENVYFVKIDPNVSDSAKKLGAYTGSGAFCTVTDAGDEATLQYLNTNIKNALCGITEGSLRIDLRFIGIDCPSIYRYSFDKVKISEEDTKERKFADIKDDMSYLYERALTISEESGTFIMPKGKNKWFRYTVEEKENSSGYTKIKMLCDVKLNNTTSETYPSAEKARDAVARCVALGGGEVYAMLDATSLNVSNDRYPKLFNGNPFNSSIGENLKVIADKMYGTTGYKYTYYNQWGMDASGRFLGTIYVKYKDNWINLTKFVLAACANSSSVSSISDDTTVSDAFKPWSYNLKDRNYADGLATLSAEIDDREAIQQKIFGNNLNALKDWTVMIGDNMFLIPPTSISCTTRSTSERIPAMRAKGTMAKSNDKTERMLELTLFFNGDEGVNGIQVECEEAKKGGEKATYKFNGLMQLLAMFKFTPFLPIENEYINKVLGIDAVSMLNFKMSTVPNFPHLISATLQLEEFNYRVYMPELPVTYSQDKFINYFASAINFKTMRYYYQRAINRGEILLKNPETLDKGERVKTALQPMKFEDSTVKFEIANEDQLKKKMQAYLLSRTKPGAKIVLTDTERQLAKDLAAILGKVKEVMASDEYKSIIKQVADQNKTKRQYAVMNISDMMSGFPNVRKVRTIRHEDTCSIILTTNFPYITNDTEYTNLKTTASAAIKADTGLFFNNREIVIPFKITDTEGPVLDTATDYDINFMAYCTAVNNPSANESGEVQSISNAADWERFDSMKYDTWDAGEIDLESITAVLGNTMSRISVSGIDGFAPQFLGGQDTTISLSFYLKDKATLANIQLLPKTCSYYMRTYRQILTAAPIRIVSEFTRFLGVSEVTIEDVTINTVPNTPGLYAVEMTVKSIDRTVRNKEALHRIDGTDNGTLNSTARAAINVTSYFDMKKKMEEVELYPDLELPTLEELNQKNFYFIRYVTDNTRKYVDPDFYFVYAHILSSQVFREGIINGIKDDEDDYTLQDKGGGQLTLKKTEEGIAAVKGVDTSSDETVKSAKKIKDDNGKTKADKMARLNKKVDTLLKETEFWNVSPNITCSFLEKEYAAQIQNHTDNKNGGNSEAEGTWISTMGTAANDTAAAIIKYLSENKISYSKLTPGLKEGSYVENSDIDAEFGWNFAAMTYIENVVSDFFKRDVVAGILKQINIDSTDSKFISAINHIITACASAASSRSEYAGETSSPDWKPRSGYFTSKDGNTVKDAVDAEFVQDFGVYAIKTLSRGEYTLLSGKTAENSGFYDQYFLDPYYNSASGEAIRLYKVNCINSVEFATEAFCRLILFWLARLLQQHIVPSVVLSMLKGDVKKEVDNLGLIDKEVGGNDNLLKQFNAIIGDGYKFDAGIVFLSALAALTNGDEQIMSLYRTRNYTALKQAMRACSSPTKHISPNNPAGLRMRKVMLALAGVGEISDYTKLGLASYKEQNHDLVNNIEEAAIKACDDPKQYWMDSFIDMIQYDHRGRMLRAFPVYYLLLIDEGRSYGQWKLHDNFYSTSSLIEMEIAKDRKNPADTAHIVMTNMYGTYATTDEDCNTIYDTNYWDFVTQIFSPSSLYKREELRRSVANPMENTKLSQGTRVHIRLGYGANADTLPTVFNGVIAEVKPGETIELVCQGDGIELMNQIIENQDMYSMLDQDLCFGSNLLDNGATPKEIMNTILNTKGGWWNKQIASWDTSFSYMFKKNPYGIVHFGDPDYTDIFKSGEPTQNIYEVTDSPINDGITWKESNYTVADTYKKEGIGKIIFGDTDLSILTPSGATDAAAKKLAHMIFGKDDAKKSAAGGPKITFDIFGKTVWDIFNICRSTDPDYILGVSPFGMTRSTIFMGLPRYYYAYDYTMINDTVVEKRKPYQQYHMYSSFIDIMQNGIYASSKNIRTCATGTYTRKEGLGTSSVQKVGPMWVDQEIFPESQKSMVVDTALTGEGIPIVGLVPGVNRAVDFLADDRDGVQSPYRIAWKMTASALQQSMRDMYTGELLVIGDPTVKPHDRIFITDTYEHMTGQAEVKGVVHMVSVNNGFTTAIIPDLICRVDDKMEITNQTIGAKMASVATGAVGALLMQATGMAISKALNGKGYIPGVYTAKSVLNGVAKVATKAGTSLTGAASAEGIAATAGRIALQVGTRAGLSAVALSSITVGAPLIVTAAIGAAIFYAVDKTVMKFVERYAENLQIMTVFPLKRNGKTMTAGMMGSKGTVFGSPSYSNPGIMKGLFAKLADEDSMFMNVLDGLFVSDDLVNISKKYRRDAGLEDSNGNSTIDMEASNNICKSIAAASGYDMAGYEKFLLQPRISSKKEMSEAFKNGAITDNKNVETCNRIALENSMVSRSPEIKPYIENNFFRIVQEETSFSNANAYPMKASINGEVVEFKAIIDEDSKGNKVYDVPFLKHDAISVLEEILKRTFNNCASLNSSDSNIRESGSFVVMKSALRVGDQSTLASMGYSFVISGLGECTKAMKKAVDDMLAEIKAKSEAEGKKAFTDFFAYYSIDSKTIGLTVKPPVISKSSDDSSGQYVINE